MTLEILNDPKNNHKSPKRSEKKNLWKNRNMFNLLLKSSIRRDLDDGTGNTVDLLNEYLLEKHRIYEERFNQDKCWIMHILTIFDSFYRTKYSDAFRDHYVLYKSKQFL